MNGLTIDGAPIDRRQRQKLSAGLMAHLSQNMRFILDTTVTEFLALHTRCRQKDIDISTVIALADSITPEPVSPSQNLNLLSGGQTRALMIADIALICDSPVVLIDEIENAGIDKERALSLLCRQDKLVLVVTHDVHTALMAPRRIVMANGAVQRVVARSAKEEALFKSLSVDYQLQQKRRQLLREGSKLI